MTQAELQEVTYLQPPEFTLENYSTTVTKIQAFRKGGIRLEHEELKGKHIFHNYGHGTSGVTFAYGSVYMSVKSLYTYLSADKPINCAVVGSGLIAMLTAIELNKLGHSVTIYANKFAKIGEKDVNKKSPSQINEGLCLPFGYETFDRFRYEVLAKISYDYYKECLITNRYQSFKCVTVYERDATIQQLKEKIPPFLFNGYQKENISFGNGIHEKYTKLKTFKINSELFIEELNIEASLRGINFVEKHFKNGEEVLELEESCIFNNVGFASKNLFNDESMVGTVDHLVIFKNNKKLDYSLSAQIHENLNIRIHCFEDKVILRNETLFEKEYYEETDEVVKNLIMEAQAFFCDKTIKPKL